MKLCVSAILQNKGETMHRNYENETDEELMVRLREGESDITDFIMDKYKNLVKKKAQSMYILGADGEDLIQEGMIGLFKAVRDYDCGRDASFFTFAELCISRQMYTAIQAAGRQKHLPLNTYVSFYASSSNQEDSSNMDLVAALTGSKMNPEELFIDKENLESLERMIEQELSEFEKQVLDLYLTGMSYTEISKVLNKDDKSTDNALQRIRGKIRRKLAEAKGK